MACNIVVHNNKITLDTSITELKYHGKFSRSSSLHINVKQTKERATQTSNNGQKGISSDLS